MTKTKIPMRLVGNTKENQIEVPAIGFGTYPLRGKEGAEAIQSAIECGYRLIDTAMNYDNEGAVGEGIRRAGVPRDELVVASKLPGRFHQRPEADGAIRESLWRLGLDYIDIYMIHWPNPIQGHFVEAWEALIDAQKAGLIKVIGTCNFTVEHLCKLESDTGLLPAINQIEIHPYFPQVEQVGEQERMGVTTEAWSPLGKRNAPYGESVVVNAANAHNVTPAQVILRWHIQRGVIPIPKTKTPSRQIENLDVFGFELSAGEMEAITSLGHPQGRLFDGDPNVHEEM